MIPYIVIFFIFAIPALFRQRSLYGISLLAVFILLVIYIGLRTEIGGDWDRYATLVPLFKQASLKASLLRKEGLFFFFHWLVGKFDGSVHEVNLIFASIFTAGLLTYCKNNKYPWLGIVIAYPVLIMIVSLGYTRQSAALGLEFFALIALENGKFLKSLFLVTTGAFFHITLISLYGLVIKVWSKYASKVRYAWKYFIIISILLFLAYRYYESSSGYYLSVYILSTAGGIRPGEYTSKGALPRLIPTLIAAAILIFNKNRFTQLDGIHKTSIYYTLALVTIFLTVLLFVFPLNTTWIDRMAIYCAPLTIYVFTRLVDFNFLKITSSQSTFIIVSSSLALTIGWLAFAVHAVHWLPYKNILFS